MARQYGSVEGGKRAAVVLLLAAPLLAGYPPDY